MENEQPAVIRFEHVSMAYGEHKVFDDVSFEIHRGEFVYVIGRTGSGKSTLLRLLYGDLKPQRGKVVVDQFEIGTLTKKQIPYLRRKLGIVFQDFQLLPNLTVGENVAFVMKATGWRDPKQIKNRITEVLMQVGMSSKANHRPSQLSGGEQQRTVIARALVNNPVVILADEPTGNLDPEVTDHIMETLHKVNLSGTSVLMVTHEHDLLSRYPGRTLECENTQIAERMF